LSVQLAERVHERYLRLIAFITHQYLTVGDALILTLNKAVASVLNGCETTLKPGRRSGAVLPKSACNGWIGEPGQSAG